MVVWCLIEVRRRTARCPTVGGTTEHGGEAGGAGEGGLVGGAGFGVQLLEGVEFGKEGVERAEEFEGCVGVQVDDGGQGEAQEEVVGCASGEAAGVEVGHSREGGLVEEKGVEPVYSALVAAEEEC